MTIITHPSIIKNNIGEEKVIFFEKPEIVEINSAIVDDPSLVNSDPEGNAWFFKMNLENKDDLNELMNEEEYKKLIE